MSMSLLLGMPGAPTGHLHPSLSKDWQAGWSPLHFSIWNRVPSIPHQALPLSRPIEKNHVELLLKAAI